MKKFVTDPDPGQTLIRIRRVAEPEPEPPGAALFEPEPEPPQSGGSGSCDN